MFPSFVITKDLINDYPSDVQVEQIVPETKQIIKDYPKKFRLLDDDEIVYFIGRMADNDNVDEFEPLDVIGTGYGCTEIQVWENDTWVTV